MAAVTGNRSTRCGRGGGEGAGGSGEGAGAGAGGRAGGGPGGAAALPRMLGWTWAWLRLQLERRHCSPFQWAWHALWDVPHTRSSCCKGEFSGGAGDWLSAGRRGHPRAGCRLFARRADAGAFLCG